MPARRPLLGYLMVLSAASLWAINGSVSKAILTSGLTSIRLAEVRSTGGVVGLGLAVALVRPRILRVSRRELPFLALFGVVGLAFVQWFYFLAIHRLEIGIALLIQYVAPVLVALYARFVHAEQVRKRIWLALILALAGLSFVVDVWGGLSLDPWGVAAALGSAVTFSLYILLAEHAVGRRDPVSLVFWGLAFAALFWAIVQPWWSFPFGLVDESVALDGTILSTEAPVWLLMAVVIVVGTIVPFGLLVGALRHISATRAGVTAMWEPARRRARRLRVARGVAERGSTRRRCTSPGGDRAGANRTVERNYHFLVRNGTKFLLPKACRYPAKAVTWAPLDPPDD